MSKKPYNTRFLVLIKYFMRLGDEKQKKDEILLEDTAYFTSLVVEGQKSTDRTGDQRCSRPLGFQRVVNHFSPELGLQIVQQERKPSAT